MPRSLLSCFIIIIINRQVFQVLKLLLDYKGHCSKEGSGLIFAISGFFNVYHNPSTYVCCTSKPHQNAVIMAGNRLQSHAQQKNAIANEPLWCVPMSYTSSHSSSSKKLSYFKEKYVWAMHTTDKLCQGMQVTS